MVTYFSIRTRPEPNAAADLAHGAFELGLEVGCFVDPAQSATAAARGRLDQHRIADLARPFLEKLGVLPFAMVAGHDRNAGLLHQRLGAIFEPHGADSRGRRTDEFNAGLRTRIGKIATLGQEPVAGMNTFGSRLPGDVNQAFDTEITFARLRLDR